MRRNLYASKLERKRQTFKIEYLENSEKWENEYKEKCSKKGGYKINTLKSTELCVHKS